MKASNFREIEGMPYTRQEYIDGAPVPKITKFTTGNTEREFDYTVELLNLNDAQISHNALEAARSPQIDCWNSSSIAEAIG